MADLTTVFDETPPEDVVIPGPYDIFHRELSTVLSIILIVVGFFGCASYLGLYCLSPPLRRSSKHFLISTISILCCFEHCINVFVVYAHMNAIDDISCQLSYSLSATSLMSSSIVILLVASVAFDSVLTLCLKKHYIKVTLRLFVAAEWTVFVVAGSVFVLLPLMNESAFDDMCNFNLKHHYMVAVNVIHVVPQTLILILAAGLFLCYKRTRGNITGDDNSLPFPADVFIASIVVIVLKFPDFIFAFGFHICATSSESCDKMYVFWMIATYCGTSVYTILPFTWWAGQDTRHAVTQLRSVCGHRHTYNRQDMYALTCMS